MGIKTSKVLCTIGIVGVAFGALGYLLASLF